MFRTKKGLFFTLTDAMVYIIFIVVFALLLLLAVFNSDRIEKSITSDYDRIQADTVLLGLMSTVTDYDVEGDGDFDTIADMITFAADNDDVSEEIMKAMEHVCTVEGEPMCYWELELPGLSLESDYGSIWERSFGLENEGVATLTLPRVTRDDYEAVEVTMRYYERK